MTPNPGGQSPLVDALRPRFRGRLITPDDPAYDEARSLYNAMIDKRPALIAQCADVADVIAVINTARDRGLRVAIRGGGHNGPGLGSCDDGVVIDLSPMRGVHVNPEARLVQVDGGCRWGDVDHATHAFGLATPSGVISTTGVGGLTLGGGHGYLTRRYGLTIDNLRGADVVLADGRMVHASEDSHPDLFWALRGGGGNFGVVTTFELALHPVKNVYGGPTLWPLEQTEQVMRWYRDFMPRAPKEQYGFLLLMTVPPGPPFPVELHGERMCGVVWCHTGDVSRGEALLSKALKGLPEPAFAHVGEMPYPTLQAAFDGLYPKGLQWYWRGDFVRTLSDEAIAEHVRFGERMPTPLSSMHLYPIDGAVHRVAEDATAFAHRDATWSQVIVGVDPDPANAERISQWTRDYHDALHPHSAGGAYVNFMMEEGEDRVRATYRGNYERLTEVKRRYDPHNFFCVNQNIRPAIRRPTSPAPDGQWGYG